jgi:hypothetical protein
VGAQTNESNNYFIVACIRVFRFLQSRCLASEKEIHFTEPLPSIDKDTHRDRLTGGAYDIRCWDGLSCHSHQFS